MNREGGGLTAALLGFMVVLAIVESTFASGFTIITATGIEVRAATR